MEICVPIKEKTSKKLLTHFEEAHKKADIIELWLDELNEKDYCEVIQQIKKCRKKKILYKVTDTKNVIKRLAAGSYTFSYIDLDVKTHVSIVEKIHKAYPKSQIIMSFHDFEGTPTTKRLEQIARKMKRKGADIFKFATYANNFADSMHMLLFLDELNKKNQKAICLCMGKEGRITREVGHLLGNYLMFAPLRKKGATAQGQILLEELKKIIKS